MVKIIYEEEPLNPTNLEKALGLNSGDIKEITKYDGGAVGVEYASTPSAVLEANVKTELNKKGLPRGKKKPEE